LAFDRIDRIKGRIFRRNRGSFEATEAVAVGQRIL